MLWSSPVWIPHSSLALLVVNIADVVKEEPSLMLVERMSQRLRYHCLTVVWNFIQSKLQRTPKSFRALKSPSSSIPLVLTFKSMTLASGKTSDHAPSGPRLQLYYRNRWRNVLKKRYPNEKHRFLGPLKPHHPRYPRNCI